MKKSARIIGQIPHGVKSDPKAVKGILLEPGTCAAASLGKAKAIGDRGGTARSPHSSPRAGKPPTRRRGTVGTECKQEGDGKPSASVNTGVILDMQSKLYRWSRSDRNKVFSDLFNLVCDRRTLKLAWKYLCRNQGSRTPGIDGVTRQKIEERRGGATEFLGTRCTKPVFRRASLPLMMRAWTRSAVQREAVCSSEGRGGGTVREPMSRASSSGSRRARVASQYLGASSR